MRLHVVAPTRIDLAGGTLDIWPLYLFHPGALTLNVAITRYAHAVLEPRRDTRVVLVSRDSAQREEFRSLAALRARQRYRLPLLAHLVTQFAPANGLMLITWSDVPAGSGLGGSSALAIAVCAALARLRPATSSGSGRFNRQHWIEIVRDIESRVLGVPTGEQDHYPAVYGGVNAIHLEPGSTRREALTVPASALEARLLLAYTGKPRRSAINNWEVLKNYLDGDRRLRGNFVKIAAIAQEMRAALREKNWSNLAALLRREWETRRRNAPGIATPFIGRLVRIGRQQGALAAKVCGAGGGGCVVFYCPPERRSAVARALAGAGAAILPFRIATRGVHFLRPTR